MRLGLGLGARVRVRVRVRVSGAAAVRGYGLIVHTPAKGGTLSMLGLSAALISSASAPPLLWPGVP